MDDWDFEEAEALPTFRHFTREDLEEGQRKRFERDLREKKRKQKRKENIAVRKKKLVKMNFFPWLPLPFSGIWRGNSRQENVSPGQRR